MLIEKKLESSRTRKWWRPLWLGALCATSAVALASAFTTSTLHAAAPAGRYTIISGNVTDNQTGLIWQQMAVDVAQMNPIQYCTGYASGAGFRLPTVKEMETLVDESTGSLDATAFPSPQPAATTLFQAADGYVAGTGFSYVGSGPGAARVRCVK